MYSAPRSIRAVALLFLSSISGTVAFPQAVKFIRNAADPLPLVNIAVGRAPCTRDSGSAVAGPYTATAVASDAGAPCDTPPVSVPLVNSCNPASPAQIGCAAPRDLVREDLAASGKTGQKILRARDKVLEILQTENACSAWFQGKDSNPAVTFRTLSYAVDRHGEQLVHVSKDTVSQFTFHDPYVARVGQDTGANATITLNAGGAFFQTQAPALLDSKDGVLTRISGPQSVHVGPYPGNSLAAQMLALLHEFGHVINLLPLDYENADGKSVQNTAEVLRFCRTEVESKAKRGTLQAAR
jgi:hypothetical protein